MTIVSSPGPTRQQGDLADMVEMLLDKGVVINADIAVSIGDTELLGIQVRAALASFETAAQYGLEFPEGTDMERVEAAAAGGERVRVERRSGETEEADVDDSDEEPDGPNRVGVRPHATVGDADSGGGSDGEDDADDGGDGDADD